MLFLYSDFNKTLTFLLGGRVVLAVAGGGRHHGQDVQWLRGGQRAEGGRGADGRHGVHGRYSGDGRARLGLDDATDRGGGAGFLLDVGLVLHGLGAQDDAEVGALRRGDGHRL